ncbi:hypothetical protein QFC19_004510 [Naganishia cerealis]|uniref:Uncharacterized protein n=1 Tax=Naganishia cerealis TaxID=610337 RepID=A0ACC2VU35_9TREE|nr:hypothetical protein QFC19_004510 [Naganishia cerealis]
MGIGVSPAEVYSPPLTAAPDDSTLPAVQLLGDDHAQQSGILIHHDRFTTGTSVGSISPVSHGRSISQDMGDSTQFLSSPLPPQTSMLPISPALSASAQLISNAHEKIPADQLPSTVHPGASTRAPSKIRFAPLPNPRRQRSMSTGRNIAVKATMEPDGTRTLQRHARRDDDGEGFFLDQGNGSTSRYIDEEAVDDEEIDVGEGDGDNYDDEEEGEGRGKRSSWKTMGMGHWKPGSFTSGSYTKKFLKPLVGGGTEGDLERLTSRESGRRISADIAMPASQSLRKTFSTTSGFIGSSPFRTAGEHERKRTFFPGSSISSTAGQTSASGAALGLLGISDKKGKQNQKVSNNPDFSSLSASLGRQADTNFAPQSSELATSPRPVKMLNGRVYGKNRQPEAANAKQAEPEFVEWGGMMGQRGGGIGSVSKRPSSTTSTQDAPTASFGSVGRSSANDEEDDGSGISWVKKRREQRERERRASELTPTEEVTSPGLYRGSLPTSNELHKNWQRGSGIPADTVTHLPAVNEDRVATPINAEHFAFTDSLTQHHQESKNVAEPFWPDETMSQLGRLQAQDQRHEHDDPGHIVQAVQIPASPAQSVQWRHPFLTETNGNEGVTDPGDALPQVGDEYEQEDEEDEDEVNGDFESDDEEELAAEEVKKR